MSENSASAASSMPGDPGSDDKPNGSDDLERGTGAGRSKLREGASNDRDFFMWVNCVTFEPCSR